MTVTTTGAFQDVASVALPAWTLETVRSLGTTTDIGTAAAILGIGRRPCPGTRAAGWQRWMTGWSNTSRTARDTATGHGRSVRWARLPSSRLSGRASPPRRSTTVSPGGSGFARAESTCSLTGVDGWRSSTRPAGSCSSASRRRCSTCASRCASMPGTGGAAVPRPGRAGSGRPCRARATGATTLTATRAQRAGTPAGCRVLLEGPNVPGRGVRTAPTIDAVPDRRPRRPSGLDDAVRAGPLGPTMCVRGRRACLHVDGACLRPAVPS